MLFDMKCIAAALVSSNAVVQAERFPSMPWRQWICIFFSHFFLIPAIFRLTETIAAIQTDWRSTRRCELKQSRTQRDEIGCFYEIQQENCMRMGSTEW